MSVEPWKQRLRPAVFVDRLRWTWTCYWPEAALSSWPHPPAHSLPTPSLGPNLVILDTLHGELVAVHPQGVAEDGQPVEFLQLEGLGVCGERLRSEEAAAGPDQAGLHSQIICS